MRLFAALIVASLASTACNAVGTLRPVEIELGKPFTLHVGGTARLAAESLQIGFDGVTLDSRCRKNEQCVSAGEVVARVWWQKGAAPKQSGELHLAATAVRTTHIGDLELALTAVEPAAISGKSIDKSAYLATLLLNRGLGTEADR